MNSEEEIQEYITEELIKEQMSLYKYIDEYGLLQTRKSKYFIQD